MFSSWYRLTSREEGGLLRVTHAWYRPYNTKSLHPEELEHVQQGGLFLETIEKACVLADFRRQGTEPRGKEWEEWGPWLEARYGKGGGR